MGGLPDKSVREQGVLTLPEPAWAEAMRRAKIIQPLAQQAHVGHDTADRAAADLGLTRRRVYQLIHQARQGEGLVTDLAKGRSGGGRGRGRLSEAAEIIISETLFDLYLHRQRRSETVILKAIAAQCRRVGLAVPSRSAIHRRIERLDPELVARRRFGPQGDRPLKPVTGAMPSVDRPLALVQIDHTKIDLIVVDEHRRQPIGRPYLTVAIDVFSRCIIGMVVTLEAPSATSVGLCLAHAVTEKQPWLDRLGLQAVWPMSGKPEILHLDNAAEFKSEALRRGCEQHGITLTYRPAGQPHFGGVVERVIGTLMRLVHELPGTTFASIQDRATYPSEGQAALALAELERWLALAITAYHGTIHQTLGEPPECRWREGLERFGEPKPVRHVRAFLVDFLPVIRRSIGRAGFVVDHVFYYADALRPWIARRDRLGPFILRRDPRDLSRLWVLDPDGDRYLEIPYRTMSLPAITLWEHRAASKMLRERGQKQVNELALFWAVEQMRSLADAAVTATKRARRDRERRRHLPQGSQTKRPEPPEALGQSAVPVKPFDELEQW
jgi:putative transposase